MNFWDWFIRPFAELAASLAFALGLFILWFIFFALPGILKQAFCKHKDCFENGSCHAICRRCRKDLGFIGSLKKE
jgi:hypothetical protein